jgi:hypothetical protein
MKLAVAVLALTSRMMDRVLALTAAELGQPRVMAHRSAPL